MPIRIKAPDGTIAQFPDGTPDATIEKVMRQSFPPAQHPGSLSELITGHDPNDTPGYRAALAAKRSNIAHTPAKGPLGAFGGGMLFGLADELEGAGDAVNTFVGNHLGNKAPYSPSEAYRASRDAMREQEASYAQRHPVASTVAGLAGAVVTPGAAGAARFVARGASLAPRIARSALIGGAYGAAAGAGNAQGGVDDRAKGAVVGGTVGAATGGALPVAGAVTRAAVRAANVARGGRIIPAARMAATRLREALQADGVGPAQIQQAMSDWQRAGNDAPSLMDVAGNNTMRLVRGSASREGRGGNLATQHYDRTLASAGARGQRRVGDLIPGGPSKAQTEDFLGQRRSQLATQEYAQPYAQPVTLDQSTINALEGAPGNAAIARARAAAIAHQDYRAADEIDRMAEARARPEATNAAEPPTISAGTLDRIHQAMRDNGQAMYERTGSRAVGAGTLNRAGQINGALDSVPGLSDARDTYRNLTGAIDALDTGASARTMSPDEFGPAFDGVTPEVQQAGRIGYRQSLRDSFGNNGQAPGLLRELQYEPNLTANTESLWGPEETRRLADFGRNESTRLKKAYLVAPNEGSQTAPRMQDDRAQGIIGLLHMAKHPAMALLDRLAAGATLTDAERALVVRAGLTPADQAMASVGQLPRNQLAGLLSGAGSYLPGPVGQISGLLGGGMVSPQASATTP